MVDERGRAQRRDARLARRKQARRLAAGDVRDLVAGRRCGPVDDPRQRGVARRAAGGDVLLKMDDDDWYGPDVVADLLRARAYSGAELVGMAAELHYLSGEDLTVKRGHPVECYASFVAGGTMMVERALLREVGGFRSVRKFVDAQLLAGVTAAGATIFRAQSLGYLLRRNPSGHPWDADLAYLLDPARVQRTWDGFHPSRLMEIDPEDLPGLP